MSEKELNPEHDFSKLLPVVQYDFIETSSQLLKAGCIQFSTIPEYEKPDFEKKLKEEVIPQLLKGARDRSKKSLFNKTLKQWIQDSNSIPDFSKILAFIDITFHDVEIFRRMFGFRTIETAAKTLKNSQIIKSMLDKFVKNALQSKRRNPGYLIDFQSFVDGMKSLMSEFQKKDRLPAHTDAMYHAGRFGGMKKF